MTGDDPDEKGYAGDTGWVGRGAKHKPINTFSVEMFLRRGQSQPGNVISEEKEKEEERSKNK